jgi:glutathione S-transferase
MKLYFSPGACSLAPHIVLNELDLPHTTVKVDLRNKLTATGENFFMINPKGSVPALQLESGQVITEGPVIMQYILDQKPGSSMYSTPASMERYELMQWLNYITSEIHKGLSPLFNREYMATTAPAWTIANMQKKFKFLSESLSNKTFLCGSKFTPADAYLFTCLGWGKLVGLDMNDWPTLKAYISRIAERPAVMAAMKLEGLTK